MLSFNNQMFYDPSLMFRFVSHMWGVKPQLLTHLLVSCQPWIWGNFCIEFRSHCFLRSWWFHFSFKKPPLPCFLIFVTLSGKTLAFLNAMFGKVYPWGFACTQLALLPSDQKVILLLFFCCSYFGIKVLWLYYLFDIFHSPKGFFLIILVFLISCVYTGFF